MRVPSYSIDLGPLTLFNLPMEHSMKLLEGPYEKISSGQKTIEIRLFDEKRQKLNVGDNITFSKLPDSKDQVKVKIVGLLRYSSFRDLVNDFGMEYFGYPNDYPIDSFINSIYTIYSQEKEQQYGVLGIKIELLNEAQN